MIKARLKYCVEDRGRWYVRKPGHRKIRIRQPCYDAEGRVTPEFMKAYFSALEKLEGKAPPKTPREETLYWLVDKFYRSAKFNNYNSATRSARRHVLDRYCETVGHLPYAKLRKSDIEASQHKRRATPAAADNLVKYLRSLFAWAMKEGYAALNPAVGIEKIDQSEGHHTWTNDEIETYRAYHEVGTKARLALEIFLCVGARISDVARLGRQHEVEGRLRFVAWKGRGKQSTRRTIDVPFLPDLALALANTQTGDLTYLVTELGQPFTIKGLGNKFRDWCDAAGLKHCSAHGLRKAAAVALAESGATAAELCAVFGWKKLEIAEAYIREANKARLSTNAMTRLEDYRNRKSVSLSVPLSTVETKGKN